MNLTAQRGAIPITLDRPRVLFFNAAATWLLVDQYGVGFATELYTADRTTPETTSIRLKSGDALQFFLWAGLQADAREHGETVTLDEVETFIRPWSITGIFHAVIQALTGALYVPPVKVGNDDAARTPARPAAKKKPAKKVSTLKTRSGLRLHR